MTDRLAASAAHAALEHVGENAERVHHPLPACRQISHARPLTRRTQYEHGDLRTHSSRCRDRCR
jgi:hypothetical protein